MLERPHLVGHVHSHNVAASAHHLARIDQVLGEVVIPQGWEVCGQSRWPSQCEGVVCWVVHTWRARLKSPA